MMLAILLIQWNFWLNFGLSRVLNAQCHCKMDIPDYCLFTFKYFSCILEKTYLKVFFASKSNWSSQVSLTVSEL